MQTFEEENPYYIGIDIGGSHFSIGVLRGHPLELLPDTILTKTIHPDILAYDFLHEILESIKFVCSGIQDHPMGIGISIPGPFIYESGTSCITGLDKFEDFFGVNLKHFLVAKLDGIVKFPDNISFLNDADSFALGECHLKNLSSKNVIGITLGTGIGSGFIKAGKIVTERQEIPADGNIYNIPYKSGQAEDWLSTRWFCVLIGNTLTNQ
jgi:predicted NBD/HSP70 family sugar kinase